MKKVIKETIKEILIPLFLFIAKRLISAGGNVDELIKSVKPVEVVTEKPKKTRKPRTKKVEKVVPPVKTPAKRGRKKKVV